MNIPTYFIGIYILIISALSQGQENPAVKLTDDNPTVSWHPTSSETIKIYADPGYQIQIDVSQLDIDGENESYVTVKSVVEDGEDANKAMFTYTVVGNPSYLYNHNQIQADYVSNNDSNHLVLNFTRVGDQITTTTMISTTSEEPMPTPDPQEQATLTVYMYGRPAGNFGEKEQVSLKTAIAKMGTEYCEVQNCPLNNSITWRNVKIEMLEMCSVNWEDYDTCVILTFALPIIKTDGPEEKPLWHGYQLSESHLKMLWDNYGTKHLGQIGLSIYSVPDLNEILKFRIIVTCLVTVTLVILILSARHVTGKIHKKRRKLSDTLCIMDQTSDRISQQSLPPHYLQELPPFLREQKNLTTNYPDFTMGFAEDDDKPISPTLPISSQITISGDINSFEDANA